VHVLDIRVSPCDEVAFTRHDQELARSAGKIRSGEHCQEALSRCGIGRRGAADSTSVALRRLLDLLARNRARNRDQAQGEETGTATAQL
jgi:hypothetical protein